MGSPRLYYSWLLMARHRSTGIICLGFWLNEGGVECELGAWAFTPAEWDHPRAPHHTQLLPLLKIYRLATTGRLLHLHSCLLLLLLLQPAQSPSIHQHKNTKIFISAPQPLKKSIFWGIYVSPDKVWTSHQRSFRCFQGIDLVVFKASANQSILVAWYSSKRRPATFSSNFLQHLAPDAPQ